MPFLTFGAGGAFLTEWLHCLTADGRDLRKPAAYLIRYPEAHSDDITSVSFSPCSLPLPTASSSSPAPLLLSSSASGLVALHNPLLADEDDALLHATDVGASVARAGFMGSPSLGPQPTDSNPTGIQGLVWARTDMDTLHSFDLDGLTKVTDWGSVKDEAVSRPTARWADSVDYIVACEWLEGAPGRLTYLAGSQTFVILSSIVTPTDIGLCAEATSPWSPSTTRRRAQSWPTCPVQRPDTLTSSGAELSTSRIRDSSRAERMASSVFGRSTSRVPLLGPVRVSLE